MSDIENDLFNNSDEDGSDEESVAESEVDYDEEAPDVTKPKLIIGDDVVDGGVEEDADEDVEYGAGSDDEVSIGEGEENDEDATAVGAAAVGNSKPASNRPTLESDNDDGEGDDEGDEDDDDEDYLQKFDRDIKKNYIVDYHPECMIHNYEEISALTKVVRDKDNMIVDPLHRTIPYLTKYERARVLGQRAKQINLGARPFVKVPENIIDGHLVAEMELMQKRIPFIIRRPLPGNSGSEYWNLKDLEIITF
jgi:DNA-directed RNA polymerase I, II, and III subunit RPABC2